MSFEYGDSLFDNINEFNVENSYDGMFEEYPNLFNINNFENEERTDIIIDDYQRNDMNNKEDNNTSEQNVIKKQDNNIKKNLESEGKTQETTNIERNDDTKKEVPKKDKILNKKREREAGDSNSGKNTRFSSDNTIRKIKHLILDSLFHFINDKIREIYHNNIGLGIFQKKLLTLNQNQKVDATIYFNKLFLKKNLCEIFSDKISTRYTSFPQDFNKNLIQNLMNEKDLEKKEFFQKLFNLTFLDCLSHFRGTKIIEELKGLKLFSDYLNNHTDDKDYNRQLNYYLNNFETMIGNKRSRKTKNDNKNNSLDKDIQVYQE